MKKITLIAAALAAVNAFAITATKEYVDNATNATLTASKSYTDQAISGIPQGMTTNAVENIADNRITNSVLSGYLCTKAAAVAMTNGAVTEAKEYSDNTFVKRINESGQPQEILGSLSIIGDICMSGGIFIYPGHNLYVNYIYNMEWIELKENTDFLTFGKGSLLSLLQPDGSEVLTKNLGDGYYASTSDVYTKTQINGNTVTNGGAKAYADAENATTRAIVATWENFLDGSNVVFSITNYISGTYNLDSAKLRIMEMTNNVYREVYNSRDEILLHINDFKNTDFRVATNQVIQGVSAAIADKADKAWGKYTSAGGEAPSNTVYMTAPNTVFAGGLEYERVAVGEGSVCILTTHGAPTYTQGDEGTFKFQDDGGTNYFGFAKTDSYVIGADASGISVQNNIVTINYDVTMSGVPCIWYKQAVESAVEWEQLNLPDGTPVAGASHVVTWDATPPAGRETCYINCPEAKGFFKATIEVAGSAKFMTNMPADLGGGIMCTNTATQTIGIIKPTYNGSSVSWSWEGL